MNKLISVPEEPSFKEYIRHRIDVNKIPYTENGLDVISNRLEKK